MKDYLMIVLAVALLAFCFILQKLFQKQTDPSPQTSVDFSILSGIGTVLILVLSSGFRISFTWYSGLNAFLKSTCVLAYTVIGFQIMQAGSISTYMLFLMSGGMLIPAAWGWAFLGETPKLLHIFGLVVILFSVVLNNLGKDAGKTRILLMGIGVFVLNGFVSVLSKLHQVNETYPMVSTVEYVALSAVASLAMSVLLKGVFCLRKTKQRREKRKGRALPLLIALAYSGICALSSVLQLEGAKNLPASMLYPMITGGTVAFSGIFAWAIFREKLSLRGWISVALCCIGTCLFL